MKLSNVTLSAVNIVGALVFVVLVRSVFTQAEFEERECCDFGDSLALELRVMPLLILFGAFNACWAVRGLWDVLKHKQARTLACLAASLCFWLMAWEGVRVWNG